MSPADQSILRAEHARQLLDNPVLQEAFEKLEAAYTNEWKNSGILEETRRETAYLMLVSLGDFRRQVEAFVTDGSITQARLKKL